MEALAAARDVLPLWVSWGAVLLFIPFTFLVALAAAAAGTWGVLRPFPPPTDAPRSSRTRLASAVRGRTALLFAVVIGLFELWRERPLSPAPPGLPAVLAGLAASAGVLLVRRFMAAGEPPPDERPPDERPRPASRFRAALALPALLAAVALGCIAPELTHWCIYRKIGNSEPALLTSLAWTGGTANEVGRLAFLHFQRGDLAGSAALYRAAGAIDPGSVYHAANLALVLSHLQRPDEARAAAQEAEARCLHNGEKPDEREVVEKAWESVLRTQMRLGPLRPERPAGGEEAEPADGGGKD
jgi:hypothetical protein